MLYPYGQGETVELASVKFSGVVEANTRGGAKADRLIKLGGRCLYPHAGESGD